MAVNKVELNGETLIDLTADTVTSEKLLSGETAHDASGAPIVGSLTPSASGGVSYAFNTKTGQHNLLKITAESGTSNGITYTIDKDAGTVFIAEGQTAIATVQVMLTNSINIISGAEYTLTGCPSGGSDDTYKLGLAGLDYDYGDGASGTPVSPNSWFTIVSGYTIPEGGLLFKPMVRYAEDEDNTFSKYSMSNRELTDEIEVVDESLVNNTGKNKLKITAESQTINGVTFTVDKQAGTITCNGTASDNAYLKFTNASYISSIVDIGSTYILSGCPSGGEASTYDLELNANTSGLQNIVDYGADKEVTFLTDNYTPMIRLISGYTASNLVFKPMIRKAGTDPAFEPYSMTNLELTRSLESLTPEGSVTEEYVQNQISAAKTEDKAYTDSSIATATAEIKAYSDNADAELTEDITDIKTADYGAGVNLLDFDDFLAYVKDRWPEFSWTESGGVYTINQLEYIHRATYIGAPYAFSDEDIDVVFTFKLKKGTGASPYVFLVNLSNEVVSSLRVDPATTTEYSLSGTASKIKITYGNNGSYEFSEFMIRSAEITDSTYHPYIKTNQQLQEDVAVLPENAKKNFLDFDAYMDFINSKTAGTISKSGDNTYEILEISRLNGNLLKFSEKDIDVKFSLDATKGTGSGLYLQLYNSSGEKVAQTSTSISEESVEISGLANQIGFSFGTPGSYTVKKPMIRPAGTSPDFVPYMRSNLELTHDTDGVRGVGRNLLKITVKSRTVRGGATFTVDKGKGTVTANGTADAINDSWFSIIGDDTKTGASATVLTLSEDCILTGCPSGGGTDTANFNYRLSVLVVGGNTTTGTYHDFGDGVLIPAGTAITSVNCVVSHGKTVSNIVFKPMIRLAKYADDPTFYPYSEPEIDFQSKLRPITVGTMYDADNVAAVHNAHPRGKDITDIFNAGELSEMISSGLFDEIYPGDYFTLPIAAVTDRWSARTFTCRVMHLNPMKYVGDGMLTITYNHIGFATDESWFDCPWNESGTTEGGYAGSTIHGRINEEAIIEAWQNALSSKLTLKQARMLLSNAVNTKVDSVECPGEKGAASDMTWYTSYFKLMSEMERYGAPVWSSGKGFNTGTTNFQLAYYANNTAMRGNKRRTWDWLLDIVSVYHAVRANIYGGAGYYSVVDAGYVRPLGFLK